MQIYTQKKCDKKCCITKINIKIKTMKKKIYVCVCVCVYLKGKKENRI